MATTFEAEQEKCEECGQVGSTASLTYNVEKKQRLCDGCAQKKRDSIQGDVKPAHVMCKKHESKAVCILCETCKLSVCQVCAEADHSGHNLSDLHGGGKEKSETLNKYDGEIEAQRQAWRNYEEMLAKCTANAEAHFKKLSHQVVAKINEDVTMVAEERKREVETVNREADEAIKKINETRDLRLKQIRDSSDKKSKKIEKRRVGLLAELQDFDYRVRKKASELKTSVDEATTAFTKACAMAKATLAKSGDDELKTEMLKESLSKMPSVKLDLNVVEHINDTVRKIEFVQERDGQVIGNIVGVERAWELIETIRLNRDVSSPYLNEPISDDEVAIIDTTSSLYVTNLKTKETRIVIRSDAQAGIRDCASLDDDTLVCGDHRNGCISLYSKQGKHLKSIKLPHGSSGYVYVTVDKNGMILAAEGNQPEIYIINPTTGKYVRNIVVSGKKIYGLYALFSGSIILRTGAAEFSVIAQSGEVNTIQKSDVKRAHCGVDAVNDVLYVVYRKKGDVSVSRVNVIAPDGKIQEENIVEFKQSERLSAFSRCVITTSGNLVICDGNALMVYRKTLKFKTSSNK